MDSNVVIKIAGDQRTVISTFLRVFLANERLTDMQLAVTAALASRYAEYRNNMVIEPYASILLFATETRAQVCKELKISPSHLNNVLNSLTKKNILSRESGKYQMNPAIVPATKLTFEFTVNG